jgi:hypothetical protein
MSSVLVIHPSDRSTDFLELIYAGRGYDVIRSCETTDEEIRAAIGSHDRILLMGHGCGLGLFNPKNYSLMIDGSHAPLLREKETVSVWCFSDVYFRRHGIPGFHTGMIISETGEELVMLGSVPLDEDEVLENMKRFAGILGECIEESPERMREHILEKYVGEDPVTRFNRESILVLEAGKEAERKKGVGCRAC